MFHIVLYQPEIPANTGNIGRLCLGTGARLHIVRPMRFLVTDAALRRAGLDYWRELDVVYHDDLAELAQVSPPERTWYFTTKGTRLYTDVAYRPGDALVFGPETRGLPAEVLAAAPQRCLRLPMTSGTRSQNLANSVAVALYEAWRQNDFAMEEEA